MKNTRAFTLVELLASMMVFSIIMLAVTGIFGAATKSWQQGSNQVELNEMGRVAIAEISKDLFAAIADENLPFAVNNDAYNTATQLGTNDFMVMISALAPRRSATKSDLTEIDYIVKEDNQGRGILYRRTYSLAEEGKAVDYTFNPGVPTSGTYATYEDLFGQDFFTDPELNGNTAVLAQNVYSFTVKTYDASGTEINNYDNKDASNYNLLPKKVVAKLTLLSDDDWNQYSIHQTGWTQFVNNRAKTFTVTMTFGNRGY